MEYSDIQICEDRRSQGENVQEPSGNADHSNLKTIYYKLEAQRLVPIYTDTTDVYEI